MDSPSHPPLNLYAVPFKATCVGTMYLLAESEEHADELALEIDPGTIDYCPERGFGQATGPATLLSTRAEMDALHGPGLPSTETELVMQRLTCFRVSAFAQQSARRQTSLTARILDWEIVRAWESRARALLKKMQKIWADEAANKPAPQPPAKTK